MIRKIIIDNRDLDLSIDTYQGFTGGEFVSEAIESNHEFDMDKVVKGLAERSVAYTQNLIDNGDEIIKSVKLLSYGSPSEYNYTTDYYKAEYEIDTEKLEEYVSSKEHIDNFEEFFDQEWKITILASEGELREENKLICKLNFYLKERRGSYFEEYDYWMLEEEHSIYLNSMILGSES